MEDLILDVLASALGRLYLFIRYRSKEKRKMILEMEYDGDYASIVHLKGLQLFAIILLIILLVFLSTVLYSIAWQVIY